MIQRESCFYWLQQLVVFCFLLFFCSNSLFAQFYSGYNLTFGQNRVQYEKRIWNYYRTSIADIYYYPQSKELAILAADYTLKTVLEMEQKLGVSLQNKIQILIYARQSDFMQSNIGLESNDFYNTGGVTPVHGGKLFLYYKGNRTTFLQDLRGGIAGLFVNHFLVGQTVGSNISASYSSAFPAWFTDGLSSFLSQKWTTDIENRVRDGVLSGRYRKIHGLPLAEQRVAGFSFWKFVAAQYGENAVAVMLYYAGATRNYERAIYYALRTPFKVVLEEWLSYYNQRYLPKPGQEDMDASVLKYKKNTDYLYPQLSPNGKQLAYITNTEGRVKVWILNLEDNKKKPIYRYHYRIETNPDYSFPLLAWHPTGNFLTLMTEYHDKVYLSSYRLDRTKFEAKQVVFINKITDFAYSSDGRLIALSGVKNGQSDVYIYNVASRSLEQITHDKADDILPRFIRNNTEMLFSSNRNNDTLDVDNPSEHENYDLFSYDVASKNPILHRITHTSGNETYGMEAEKDYISFLSDLNGINNRYLGQFKNVISHIDTGIHYTSRVEWYPISNYNTGIYFQDIDKANASVVQQLLRNGQQIIGMENYIRFSGVAKRDLSFPIPKARVSNPVSNPIPEPDTNQHAEEMPSPKRLRQLRLSDIAIPASDTTTHAENEKEIATNAKQEQEVLLPRNYEIQYFINKMVAQADFSFLSASYQQFVKAATPLYLNPGLNAFLAISIQDLMEDYRMTGGVRISVDLNNLEFLYSYENLKHRLDRQLVLYYQSLKSFDGLYDIRQQNVNMYYILKYPFDRVNSLHTSATFRYNRYGMRSVDDYSLHRNPEQRIWIGAKVEYIADNTRQIAINLLRGFRGKFFAEYSCIPNKEFNNMLVLGLDVRHYTKLHPTLVWANRFAASASLGKNRLIYYMGGVDNWIFPKFNQEVSIDTTVNYSYQTLATNMRGFTQNIRNGTNFFVLNSELRFQIIQCFSEKPLRSEFLQSLQLILFGDVGTAWVGLHPYLENNVLFTRIIQRNAIKVTLKKQTEPIVGAFGVGLRFQLFSYFIRLDYAWGVENYKVNNKGVFYLSFNLDF
jgi:WD40 repeat protein